MTIIQACAPTTSHSEEEIDDFYEELKDIITRVQKGDIMIFQGDWNTKVGKDAQRTWKGTTGGFGWGDTNDRRFRLLVYSRYRSLVLANTLHAHKASRIITWHAPNGVDYSQIDNIMFPRRYISEINTAKTRSFPGADIGSNHELVMMTIKIRLKVTNGQTT